MPLDSNPKSGLMAGLTVESNVTSDDEIVAIEDGSDTREDEIKYQGLVAYVKNRYDRAKTKRLTDETRWLEAYRNFRGLYGPDVQFTDTEKSKAFVKITKTKVFAAYAQITEILFSGNKFPIGAESLNLPKDIEESVHFDPKEQSPQGGSGGPQTNSTVSRPDILKSLGPHEKQLERIKDKLKPGPGLTPSALTWSPAKDAAKKLEKKFQDQLNEANASSSLRSFVFEMALFGHGVYKGPFAKDKEYPKWTEEGKYDPITQMIPDFEFVSVWDSYPDPDAINQEDAEYFVQRHRMSKSQLRTLKNRPMFRADAIDATVEDGFSYTEEYWENALRDYTNHSEQERFEVFEYWGLADKDFEEFADMKIPEKFKDKDQIQINAWICNGHLLRLVFNPYTPVHIPYYSAPYELNPYSFFGVGVAENMSDTQLLMNGFMRNAVDNAVLSSNVMLEVNDTNLVNGQDMKIYPGKIWKTNGQLGQSIHSLKIDNHTQEALLMFDKARQLADEATGMPSYSHGQSGITGVGRTASGMSMLMGAAKENIKSVVRNIDDFLLVPLGKALFAFNMQFDFDKEFISDIEIVARGTESLMRNEIRSQKVLQFLQITNNPTDSPFVKRDYLLRELAESLELEADKCVNDLREAGIQAAMMLELMKAQGIDPMAQGGGQGTPNTPDVGNGAGTAAPGAAPEPGAPGFAGGGGGANGGQQPQQ